MFFHHRDLAYTVRVDKPNPVFARMLQQAIGGPEGEMRVMTSTCSRASATAAPKKYRDMLLSRPPRRSATSRCSPPRSR